MPHFNSIYHKWPKLNIYIYIPNHPQLYLISIFLPIKPYTFTILIHMWDKWTPTIQAHHVPRTSFSLISNYSKIMTNNQTLLI